jgi:hypothetical protein
MLPPAASLRWRAISMDTMMASSAENTVADDVESSLSSARRKIMLFRGVFLTWVRKFADN